MFIDTFYSKVLNIRIIALFWSVSINLQLIILLHTTDIKTTIFDKESLKI